jgi:hypothetical protein
MLVQNLVHSAESRNNPEFTGHQISLQETLTKNKDSKANTQFKQTTTRGFSKKQPSTTHDDKTFRTHSEINQNNNSVSMGTDEGCASKSVPDGHIEGFEEELKQHMGPADGITKLASPQPVILLKDDAIPTMSPVEDDAVNEEKEHLDAISVKDVEQEINEDQGIPPTVTAQDDAGILLEVEIPNSVYKSKVDHVNHVGCSNEDKGNVYSLDALVAEHKQKKGDNQEDVSKTGTPTVKNNDSATNSEKLTSNQAVDTGILEHKNVTYNQLSGVIFDDEDSSVSSEEKKKDRLHALCGVLTHSQVKHTNPASSRDI